ncbi:hypothetical protein SPHINGOT1_10369 [Sphingomonas sp. T1]|nr:hypothetical protein SPHINGOT1_10369 [Sphingomonas sp. T1]
MKRERENPGCPCNCKRRAIVPSCHWDPGPEKAARRAVTREPGDLPVAVVFRPARVRRADGGKPARRHNQPAACAAGAYVMGS